MAWPQFHVLFLVTVLLGWTTPGSGQETEKPDFQPGLRKDVKVVHAETPVFRFQIPTKKKLKKIAALWKSVDTEVRLKAIMASLDKQIAQLEGRDPPAEDQIQALKQRKARTAQRFQAIKCLIEVKGDATQSVTVYVQDYSNPIDQAVKAQKAQFAKWSGVKYHFDSDITSKGERKKGIQRYLLDVVGTPAGSKSGKRWLFLELMIRPGKGGRKYLVTYVQNRSDIKRTKTGQSDAKLLHACLNWR